MGFWAKRPNVKTDTGSWAWAGAVSSAGWSWHLVLGSIKHLVVWRQGGRESSTEPGTETHQPHHGGSIPGPGTHAASSPPIGRPGPSGCWLDQWEGLLQWPGAGGGRRPRCSGAPAPARALPVAEWPGPSGDQQPVTCSDIHTPAWPPSLVTSAGCRRRCVDI